MAFGRKKNNAAEASPQSGGGVALAEAPSGKGKKRKPSEMLSNVIMESTPSAAIQLMRETPAFALPNGKSWVVLGLPVANIGGLSQKHKNDEAKGSIIELIKADNLKTVATAEMLESEIFAFIPTEDTLFRMDEYGLLKNAKYVWVSMTQTDGDTLTADPISDADYASAVAVSRGDTTLAALLPEVWVWGGGNPDDAVAPATQAMGQVPVSEDPFAEAGVVEPVADPHDNPFADNPEDDGVDYGSMVEDDSEGDEFGPLDDAEDEFPEEYAAEAEAQEPEAIAVAGTDYPYDPERVVTEEEVQATIARRFLTTDLDLAIDLETFEVNFNTNADAIVFPLEDEATDWLGRQVNQLARQANTELEALHYGKIDELRELYVSLMSQHIESVIAHVSPDREGSYYKALMEAARAELSSRQNRAPEEASAQRKELNTRYEADAASHGRQAAEHAEAQFRRQNRARHERELAEITALTERGAEEIYNGAQQSILEIRRKDADTRIDLGTTKILEVLMERQAENREASAELIKSWSGQITEFIDANRKDDVARAETLSLKLSRENEVAAVRSEHADRVRELKLEHQDKLDRMEKDMRKVRKAALTKLAAREESWGHNLTQAQQRTTEVEGRLREALQRADNLDDSYKAQYSQQIEILERDKNSYALELERAAKIQGLSSKTMIGFVIVAAFAALLVGFIIGSGWGSPKISAAGDIAPLVAATGSWINGSLTLPFVG